MRHHPTRKRADFREVILHERESNIVELARNEETLVERGYCPVGILCRAEQMAVDRLDEV